jgi:hypothetical protein
MHLVDELPRIFAGDCLKTLDNLKSKALGLSKWGKKDPFLPPWTTNIHAPDSTERLFRQSPTLDFSHLAV